MNKLVIQNIVTATFRMDNSTEEGREYNISADVQVSGDRVEAVYNGSAVAVDGNGSASFSDYNGGSSVNFSFEGLKRAARLDVMDAVDEFIEQAKVDAQGLLETLKA